MRKLATQAYRSSGRRVNLPAVREVMASAYASARRKVNLPAVPELAAHAYRSWGRRVNWTTALGLALVVVLSLGVYHLLSGSPHAAVAASAASKHAATDHHPRHARPNPAPEPSQPAEAPWAAPAMPAQTLTPVHASAFGPGWRRTTPSSPTWLIGGHRAPAWHTDWYTSARFGNLYPGTGLLLDMGRPVDGHRRPDHPRQRARRQLADPNRRHARTGSLPPAARVAGTGGTVRLRLTTPAHGRYVLVWFTRLPARSGWHLPGPRRGTSARKATRDHRQLSPLIGNRPAARGDHAGRRQQQSGAEPSASVLGAPRDRIGRQRSDFGHRVTDAFSRSRAPGPCSKRMPFTPAAASAGTSASRLLELSARSEKAIHVASVRGADVRLRRGCSRKRLRELGRPGPSPASALGAGARGRRPAEAGREESWSSERARPTGRRPAPGFPS